MFLFIFFFVFNYLIDFRVRQNVAAPGRNRSRNNNVGRQGGNQQQQQQQQRGPNRPKNQQPKRGGRQQARGRSQKKIGSYCKKNSLYQLPKLNSIYIFKFIVRREPPKSKEQLDAELDQYMVNTKSSLDQEMSLYTN